MWRAMWRAMWRVMWRAMWRVMWRAMCLVRLSASMLQQVHPAPAMPD
jgi:hypothetical protein